MEDVIYNVNNGFNALEESFDHIVTQMEQLKHFDIGPTETYNLLGDLFFEKEVVSIGQMSVIKHELQKSHNFKHLGDEGFSAYDLYNAVTESLKTSHPTTYISDHTTLHKLFETTFGV